MEKLANKYLKQWLGVPKSFSSVGLFSNTSKLQLPITSVADEYQTTKARQVMLLEDSSDPCVSQAEIQIEGGRKWRVSESVNEAKQRLRHKDIIGTVAIGRQGLGCNPRQSWLSSDKKGRRQLIQSEIRNMQEEQRMTRAASMTNQGSWLNWESVTPKKISWKELWSMEPLRISHLFRSVYDLLPSPSNLCLWKVTDSPNCKLCEKPAHLKHVLSSCQVALTSGRYKWRHDKVLSEIAHHLAIAVKSKRANHESEPVFINFTKQGSIPKTKQIGLLPTAKDWELLVDLKTQLKFPQEIAATIKRPDIVLWSKATKQVVLIELTVPWEERIEEAYQRKMLSYDELVHDCRTNGWKTWCLPIEVGCRGFAAQSLWRCLKLLGIVGKQRKDLIKSAENAAEAASRWLFEKRNGAWQQQQGTSPTEQKTAPPLRKKLIKPKSRKLRNPIKLQKEIVNPDMFFFFGWKMTFKNFHPCHYEVDLPEPYGRRPMHSVEQLYMFRKSFYFSDEERCWEILDASNARATKALGADIKGFIPEVWDKPKNDVMKECLVRKFTDSIEHQDFTHTLLTSPKILIEASPSDTYWGIGFSKEEGPYVLQQDWGDAENWLGRLLMGLQRFLQNINSLDPNTNNEYWHIYRKVQRRQMFTYSKDIYNARTCPKAEPFRIYLNRQEH